MFRLSFYVLSHSLLIFLQDISWFINNVLWSFRHCLIVGFRRPLLLFTKKDITEIASLQSTVFKSNGFDDEKLDSIVSHGSPQTSPADASVTNETASDDIAVVPVAKCDAMHNSTNHVGIVYALPFDMDACRSSVVAPSSTEPALEVSNPCTASSEVADILEVSSCRDGYSLTTASSQSIARGEPEDDTRVSVSAVSSCPDTAAENFDSGDVNSKECASPLVNSVDDWMPAVRTVCNGGPAL